MRLGVDVFFCEKPVEKLDISFGYYVRRELPADIVVHLPAVYFCVKRPSDAAGKVACIAEPGYIAVASMLYDVALPSSVEGYGKASGSHSFYQRSRQCLEQ